MIIDRGRREATIDGTLIVLKTREFDLLATLAHADGRVLTRDLLLDMVWPAHFQGENRTVDVRVRRLRVALAEACATIRPHNVIISVHGVGYRFIAPVAGQLQSVA